MQLLCEHRRKLVNHRVALTNRLTSLLKQYFPQALDWVGELASRQGCDFLQTWPTLGAVQRARPATVRRFYQQHNCRRGAVIDARLAEIDTAQPLTTDPAIVDTLSLTVQTYATQLRPMLDAIATFDAQIAAVFAQHPDQALFASFPGAGPVGAPRLAAAFGTDRTRWHAATELQTYAGIAPVTERSGKTCWVPSPPRLSEVSQANVSRVRGPNPFASRAGRAGTTTNSGGGAIPTMPHCARWPSSGCGFCSAAGRTGRRTTTPSTSTPSADMGRP